MSSSWWQGLFNRGKFQLPPPAARRRGRRRKEARRILFEPLEPRVLLAANPSINLSEALTFGQSDSVQRPIPMAPIGGLKSTTMTLSTSQASVVYGTAVTFTATVTATRGVPTGNVDFYDTTTSTDLGLGTLGGSTGSTSTCTLATTAKTFNVTGGDIITATYSDGPGFRRSGNTTTQTVTPLPITVTGITAANNTYDGGTAATLQGLATASLAGVLSGDTVTLGTSGAAGTFASKDVGQNIAVSVTGLTLGGAEAGDYSLTQPTTAANITARAITVTAATASKAYDGTTCSTAMPTITGGSLATGDTAAFTETFNSNNAGTGETLTPTGSVNDGNGGDNYAVTFVASTTGTITPAASISGPSTANEGDVYTLGLSAAFSSDDWISQWQVNWGDGQVQTVDGDPSSVGHVYAAAAPYVITASAADNYGTSAAQGQVDVLVSDVPPVLTVAGNQSAIVGQSFTISDLGTFTDTGFDNPPFIYQIDWGDGTSDDSRAATIDVAGQLPGADGQPPVATEGSFDGTHTYAACGAYTVTVDLSDSSSGEAASQATFQVFVAADQPAVCLGPADANGQPALDFQAIFVQGDASAPIADPAATISDPASGTLQGLTATIDGWTAGGNESLAADTTGTNITATFASGTLTLSGSDTLADYQQVLGTVTYSNSTSDLTGENGVVRTIEVVALDGTYSSPTATASITLLAQDLPPVANNDSATTNKDADLAIAVLSNDSDPSQGDAISVTDVYSMQAGVKVDGTSAEGVPLEILPDGTVGYYPTDAAATQHLTAGQSLTDSFFYTISDSGGLTSTPALVTVTVTGQNDPPLTSGIPDVAQGDGDPSTVIDLTQYFSDSQSSAAALTYSVVGDTSPALFTALSVDPEAQTLTLAYAAGTHGAAQITVRATDPEGLYVDSTFTVRSAATNAALNDVALTSQLDEGQTATLSGQLSGTGPLTLIVDWGDYSAPVTIQYAAGSTSFSLTHQYLASADYGDGSGYTVQFCLTDSIGMEDQGSLAVYVAHVAPTLGNVQVSGATYVGDTGTLTGTISAPNPQEGFTLDVDWGDGCADNYTLGPGTTSFSETHQFQAPSSGASVTLTDEYGSTATATAPLSVVAPMGEPFVVAPLSTWYTFDVVAKSYIFGLPTIGSLAGRLGSGSISSVLQTFGPIEAPDYPFWTTNDRLWLFAQLCNTFPAFNQDPRTPAMDGSYRLYTHVAISVLVTGNTITSWRITTTMDAGQEAPLVYGTINMTTPTVTTVNTSTIDVWWQGWGHPNYATEPSFQWVALRSSLNIWNQVDVQLSASGGTASCNVVSFLGSAFPSRKLWINSVLVAFANQGPFSDLWQPDPTNPSWVAQ